MRDSRRFTLLGAVILVIFAAAASRRVALAVQVPMPRVYSPAIPQRQEQLQVMRMRVDGDRVTAELRAVPLHRVLEELAGRTGIVFEVGMQENDPVSMSLFRVSLREAIQRIVGNNNSIFYFARDASGQDRIQYVRIFSRVNRAPQPSIRYIGTGTKTKTDEDIIDTPEQALKVLEESENLEARQRAIEVLVTAKGAASVQSLAKALADKSPEIRAAAIEGLAGLGARTAIPQILECLKDSHPGVRQSAVMAVAILGDVENLKDLRVLLRDQDPSVAAAAEMAIQKLTGHRP